MESIRFDVPSISCANCVAKIERELAKVDGVITAKADSTTKSVEVTVSDAAAVDRIAAALQKIGCPPKPMK
jgi:Cu2+-exporting ATPase